MTQHKRSRITIVAGARPNFMKIARPVTVQIGTNYLAGTKQGAILAAAREILSGRGKKDAVPPLWDGRATERIVDILLRS